jgi:hypothetical protein
MNDLNVLVHTALAGIALVVLIGIRQQLRHKVVARVPASSRRRLRRHRHDEIR